MEDADHYYGPLFAEDLDRLNLLGALNCTIPNSVFERVSNADILIDQNRFIIIYCAYNCLEIVRVMLVVRN